MRMAMPSVGLLTAIAFVPSVLTQALLVQGDEDAVALVQLGMSQREPESSNGVMGNKRVGSGFFAKHVPVKLTRLKPLRKIFHPQLVGAVDEDALFSLGATPGLISQMEDFEKMNRTSKTTWDAEVMGRSFQRMRTMNISDWNEFKDVMTAAISHAIGRAGAQTGGVASAEFEKALQYDLQEEILKSTSWQKEFHRTLLANRFTRKEYVANPGGIVNFFKSVGFLDWLILLGFYGVFQLVYRSSPKWSGTQMHHAVMLLFWVAVSLLYCLLVTLRMGAGGGVLFINGYILELVFLIENVFLCHSLLHTFRMPVAATRKALYIMVNCRVVFQMLFYMGIARSLFAGALLPYVLGAWLLWIAVSFATTSSEDRTDVLDTRIVHLAKFALGDRLSMVVDSTGSLLTAKAKDSKTRLTMVGFLVIALVLSDAVFYIDVALTKMEELYANAFLCYGSAIAAAFAMPEMVFVTRDLFQTFPGVKYGIIAILLYISLQMFLNRVWKFPIYVDVSIWAGIVFLSATLFRSSGQITKTQEVGTQAGAGLTSEDQEDALSNRSKAVATAA